jgi:hypothetical protein
LRQGPRFPCFCRLLLGVQALRGWLPPGNVCTKGRTGSTTRAENRWRVFLTVLKHRVPVASLATTLATRAALAVLLQAPAGCAGSPGLTSSWERLHQGPHRQHNTGREPLEGRTCIWVRARMCIWFRVVEWMCSQGLVPGTRPTLPPPPPPPPPRPPVGGGGGAGPAAPAQAHVHLFPAPPSGLQSWIHKFYGTCGLFKMSTFRGNHQIHRFPDFFFGTHLRCTGARPQAG